MEITQEAFDQMVSEARAATPPGESVMVRLPEGPLRLGAALDVPPDVTVAGPLVSTAG